MKHQYAWMGMYMKKLELAYIQFTRRDMYLI